jgi:IPT/TIG domain
MTKTPKTSNPIHVNPDNGTTAGGVSVTITGGPWDEETIMFATVKFGDCDPIEVDYGEKDEEADNYISIVAKSPPHKAGKVDITVITPDGHRTKKEDAFTYYFKVDEVHPERGKVEEDRETAVIITANDLADVEAVEFGEKRACVDKISPFQIRAIVPYREKKGKVVVKVRTPRGENTDKHFEYL